MLAVAASTAPRYALMVVSLRAHAPNQVIVHGHSCRGAAVLGCAVPRLTASGTALGEEDGRTERGNIRVDLSRPIVIQRLRRTRGGRYFIYRPPGRYSKHRPPWARRSRATAQRAGVLDDEQRRPASGRPPGCPAAAAGHPPSFPVRLRVEEPPTTIPNADLLRSSRHEHDHAR